MNKIIIAISGKQLSGKDAAAKLILEKFPQFKRIGLGDAIKLEYASRKGLTVEEIEANKATYRQDLINLGDEGRAIDSDYWIKKIVDCAPYIVVPDIRVKYEFDFFKVKSAVMVRIEASEKTRASRGALASVNDLTECALDGVEDWDFVVDNNGTYEDFLKNLQPLFDYISTLHKG